MKSHQRRGIRASGSDGRCGPPAAIQRGAQHPVDAYGRLHGHPLNLAIHLATAPLFALGLAAVALCAALPRWELWLGAGVCLLVYAALLQRFGHRFESERASPVGPVRGVVRFVHEQLVTFPRFVVRGGWAHNMGWSRCDRSGGQRR